MLTSNAIIRNNTTNTTLALLICLWSKGSGTYQPAVFVINTGSYWREKNPALLQPYLSLEINFERHLVLTVMLVGYSTNQALRKGQGTRRVTTYNVATSSATGKHITLVPADQYEQNRNCLLTSVE
jgi:hypothetical protein